MKKFSMLLIAFSLLLVFSPVLAEETHSHDSQTDHSSHKGTLIRETDIEGHHLSYHLIDIHAQMKNEQEPHDMAKMSGTHHLMVYIQGPEGKTIDSAQTGYLVVGPNGATQKVMAMEMSGGYGADIDLSKPGDYTIKCKAVAGEKKLFDEFTYKLEK